MTRIGIAISTILLFLTFDVLSQEDTVTFLLEPHYKNTRHGHFEVYRDSIPREIIVLNCEGDTLGKHSSNTNKTNSDSFVVQVNNYENHDFPTNIKSRCESKFGKKHGDQVDYYDFHEIEGNCIYSNTLIKVKGSWKNGLKHGSWIYYQPNGKIEKTVTYKKGKKIS